MTSDRVPGSRLNPAVSKMGDYTLRRTDVNPAEERARAMKHEPIIDARLGDPNVFGLGPYPRYVEHAAEAIMDKRSWRYNDARGLPELRAVLADGNAEFGFHGYEVPVENVILGPGISGVSRHLFSVLMGGNDEVVIPEWSYIIYLAEAALSGAKVVNAKLTDRGQIDLQHLEDSINERTKAVFVTTVGNPVGVAMTHENFAEIMRMVNSKEKEYNHPIYLVVDTIYEGFRMGGAPIDPIGESKNARVGPTIELYSISKMISAPGARLGWMRVSEGLDFHDETGEFIEALSKLVQPSLGSNSTAFQIALHKLYSDLSRPLDRATFDEFRTGRRMAAISRVRKTLEALSGIDGIVFPSYYYKADGMLNPDALNSFYVLFGVESSLMPRGNLSQARQLADFLIDSNMPVVLSTPGDSFLSRDLRGAEQEYTRLVALFEKTDGLVEGIGRFVESRRKLNGRI